MSGLFEALLLVWTGSLVVLAAALAVVVITQGLARHVRALLERPARPHASGDRIQAV